MDYKIIIMRCTCTSNYVLIQQLEDKYVYSYYKIHIDYKQVLEHLL
jgi:hypothetical protein